MHWKQKKEKGHNICIFLFLLTLHHLQQIYFVQETTISVICIDNQKQKQIHVVFLPGKEWFILLEVSVRDSSDPVNLQMKSCIIFFSLKITKEK